MPRLLGTEGEAAAIYFALIARLIAADKVEIGGFRFEARNRRPATDPVNALLSFSYALATRLFLGALVSAGFDPYQGFYHWPRHGRPALALDMMEPFRPLLCDSTVLMVINNGEVGPHSFVKNGPACALKGAAPQDEIEAMLAAQMAAVHMATMTAARRLNHVETLPQQDSASALFNKLARTFAAQVDALKRYRTGGEQRVTVQHVHVAEGGQAIVGNVATGGRGARRKPPETP